MCWVTWGKAVIVTKMSDALLAGLPRIVRASDEIRLRGVLAIAVGAAAAVWWVMQWLLDQPMEVGQTALVAGSVVVLAAIAAAANSSRRLAAGLAETRFPGSNVVFETRADGRDRRLRFSGAVFLTVVVVLMFDLLAQWGGVTAGIVAGAALAVGAVDLIEARRWERAEIRRDAELLLLVRPKALVASYGEAIVFEIPNSSSTYRPEVDL